MGATVRALRVEALGVIRDIVQPAYRDLYKFVHEEYVPGTRTTLAVEDLPDGKAFYRSQILEYTTLDTSPEEIHAFGLSEGRQDPRRNVGGDEGGPASRATIRRSSASCVPIRSSTPRRRRSC